MELSYLLHQSVSGFIMQTCHRKLYIKMTNGAFELRDLKGHWGRGRHRRLCLLHPSKCSCMWMWCMADRMSVDFYFPLCVLLTYSCHVERWWLALWRPQILHLQHSLQPLPPVVERSEHQRFGEWTSECRVMVSVLPSASYLDLSSLAISQGSRKWMEKEKKMRQCD